MSVFESLAPIAPTPEQGVLRVKRILAQVFQQAENALGQVRQVTERHGADQIQAALGNDRAEVVRLYQALKSLVEQHKPGAAVPDMPTTGGPKREF